MDYLGVKNYILTRLEQELPDAYHYHCYAHTQDVLRATEEICSGEGVSGKECLLVKTGALFHDAGYIYGPVEHEERGCEIAQAVLPGFGYRAEEIAQICGMIRATRVPQQPTNLLEEILCDADLDYLGRSDFERIADRLFEELSFLGRIQGKYAWNHIQVAFLKDHQYFTKTNRERRAGKKADHLARLLELVNE